uniref:Single stranded DNA binding protein 4 n=1 Tax=Paramormyrops kingsleyae TaxID=1676925 RepID=A0A3B3TDZ4_9TELE
MYAKGKGAVVPSDSQAREKLALYVYEYLLHVGAQKSAQTFLSEAARLLGWCRMPRCWPSATAHRPGEVLTSSLLGLAEAELKEHTEPALSVLFVPLCLGFNQKRNV